MQADRTSVACGRAHLRAEHGDTLIEVLIAALMVALIATASLGGFGDLGHLSEDQRNQEQAAALAQQDQARLRGLSISQLSANGTGTGNWQSTTTVDGTNYKVTSTSKFVSGANGGTACSGSGTNGAADEVQTTSTVTWGTNYNNGGRAPVIVHGLITPNEGGSLVADATDENNAGLSGVTVTLSGGPTTVSPLSTDSNGCAVFAGLSSGSYTVTFTPPTGSTWVLAPSGGALSQTATVTAAQTQDVAIQIAQAASVQARFTTTYNGATVPATVDTLAVANGQLVPAMQMFGTDSTASYASTVTATGLYPFPSSEPNSYLYSAWAGAACAGEEPPSQDQPQAFSLSAGGTTSITIPEQAMIILPYTGMATPAPFSDDDRNSALSYSSGWTQLNNVSGDYDSTETDGSTANATMTFTFTGTSVTWIGTETSQSGYANVSLDGGTATSVDLYSASTVYGHTIYSASGLSAGTHTLTITVAGEDGTGSYNRYGHWTPSGGMQVSIDEITGTAVTYSQGPLMTSAPDVTVTSTGSGCNNREDYPPTQVPTQTQGALVSPGLPYGTYTVCVDNGTGHVTQTVTNENYTTGTTVTADLYSGGTGYGTGTCT